jgi:hypothetical protein
VPKKQERESKSTSARTQTKGQQNTGPALTSTRAVEHYDFDDWEDLDDSEDLDGPAHCAHGRSFLTANKTGSGDLQLSDTQRDGTDLSNQEAFEAGRYNQVPFSVFVALAANASRDKASEMPGVISDTWQFCRFLKAHPHSAFLAADELIEAVPWAETGFDDAEVAVVLNEYDKVAFAAGKGPLDWAREMAEEYPLIDPPGPRLGLYARFCAIAGWLQTLRGDQPIVLPVEKLASVLGVSPRSITSLRQLAIRAGILEEVAPYKKGLKATQFKFAVERFSIFRERQ